MSKLANTEDVTLGSGDLFMMLYADSIPADSELEVDANCVAHIDSGATLKYGVTYKEVEDSRGEIIKAFITKEDVTFGTGILSWNGNVIAMLCETARVTTTPATAEAKGKRVTKIGGADNASGKYYVIRFRHLKDDGCYIRVTVKGKNLAGFSLPFQKEDATVIDAEIKAFAQDNEGTLVIIEEELPMLSA
ncbi:MAG: hypothetical protein J6F30_08170 [Cellulosilyticum sp.]|nr:hypothetical protein [Cellulosilyticum sp.]